jgi:hypothetical protein
VAVQVLALALIAAQGVGGVEMALNRYLIHLL